MLTNTLRRVGPDILLPKRAHPPDRGQGAAETEASEPVAEAALVPR